LAFVPSVARDWVSCRHAKRAIPSASGSEAFFVDIVFGDLVRHFGHLFPTLWLYAAAICLTITGLFALMGQGPIVLILVLIALGNPSSGGPVPRPLLNSFYSGLNPVLPQGRRCRRCAACSTSATGGSLWCCCAC
jgi:hypothetical protein